MPLPLDDTPDMEDSGLLLFVPSPLSFGCWQRMMEYVRADPSRFSVSDVGGVASFEELLVRVDHSVLCGTIFQGCIEQVRGPS